MKRIFALVLVLALAIGCLAGCGEDKKIKDNNNGKDEAPSSEKTEVGTLITDIFDIIFETDDKGENGVLDNSGVASQGGLTFFQKIAKFFQEIADFFRNLFSFGKK